MGAWGPGHFQNDSALDWLGEFNSKRSLSRLTAPLTKGSKDKDGNDWDEAFAAAEIVALMRGWPSKDCPEDLQIWAGQNQSHPEVALVSLARKFVAHAVAQAGTKEFRELFTNVKEADTYLADKKKFLKRLKANYRKLPKQTGQGVAEKPRKEPWVFIGYVKIKKEYGSGSQSYDGSRLSIAELPEQITLKPRPGSHISLEVGLDYFFTPEEIERLTHFIQDNGQHRVKLYRLSGGTYFKNKDLMTLLEKVAPHLEYLNSLLSSVELAPLKRAGRLSKLSLYFNNKIKGADLTYLSGMKELELLCLSRMLRLPSGDVFSQNQKLKKLSIGTEELEENRLPELPESLEELSLSIGKANKETDLSSLTRLPNLRRLALSADQFKPVPEKGLARLECCHFSSSVDSIDFLRIAKNLIELLPPSTLRSLDFLKGMKKLRGLKIGGHYKQDLVVTDLSPLKTLPNLRTLTLHHSSKIDRLPKLTKVERFEFYGMPQLKMEELSNFPTLREVSTLCHQWTAEDLAQLKASAPRAKPADRSLDWHEAEPSRYTTYFL